MPKATVWSRSLQCMKMGARRFCPCESCIRRRRASRAQCKISAPRRRILLADDAVAEAARRGLESPVHRAAGMKRLVELDFGAVENLDRIAARIVELHHFEDVTFAASSSEPTRNLMPAFGQLLLHRAELFGAGDAEAEVLEIVASRCRASRCDDASSPCAGSIDRVRHHRRVPCRRFWWRSFSIRRVLDPDAHVAQLGYLDHFVLRSNSVASQTDSPHWRNRSLRGRSPSSENAIADAGYFGIIARTVIERGRNRARRAQLATAGELKRGFIAMAVMVAGVYKLPRKDLQPAPLRRPSCVRP